MFDLEELSGPISAEDPCGPDLDAEGDVQFLNYFAAVEPLLPSSYFEARNANGEIGRFDPKQIKFDEHIDAAKPLVARTRDLRLIILLAKLSILNRDLSGFITGLEAVAMLLERRWEEVNPRSEDGAFVIRMLAIEAVDVMPTVVMPLHFVPLIFHRRFGAVTYRSYLLARGDVAASSADENSLDMGAIDRAIAEADVDLIRKVHTDLARLVAVIDRIQAAWDDRSGEPLSLEKLRVNAKGMADWFRDVLTRRDPTATPAEVVQEDAAATPSAGSEAMAVPSTAGVTSTAAAAAALAGVANYFARSEPSSPALLLVRQAEQMLGKSFVEVMRMMLPTHVEQSSIHIGREHTFDLPIERMASLTEGNASHLPELTEEAKATFAATSRAQALRLLEHVAAYYRVAEPSSPIPFLIDRARELAQRDFVSLLKSVLPDGVLKGPENNQS